MISWAKVKIKYYDLSSRVEPKFQFWGERGVLLNKSLCICFCFTENVKAGVFWKEMIIFTTLSAFTFFKQNKIK